MGVARQEGKLFHCPRVLKSCFNAYVLPGLQHSAPVQMSSAESHLNLLDRVVYSAERLCEGEFFLWYRRKIITLGLLYAIYHRLEHPMNEYLKHLVATRTAGASADLCVLLMVMPSCKTDQLSRYFLPDFMLSNFFCIYIILLITLSNCFCTYIILLNHIQ